VKTYIHNINNTAGKPGILHMPTHTQYDTIEEFNVDSKAEYTA